MKHKKLMVLMAGLLLLSLILAACGSASTEFPTGKFIKEGTTEYGLQFNEDGTFQVFNGEDRKSVV